MKRIAKALGLIGLGILGIAVVLTVVLGIAALNYAAFRVFKEYPHHFWWVMTRVLGVTFDILIGIGVFGWLISLVD